MGAKALCIGINDYPGGGVLNGAAPDAIAWADLLRQTRGLAAGEVTTLLDREATTAAIRAAMNRLVDDAVKGDARVLVMAGHGSTAPVSNAAGLDAERVFCPFDLARERISIREVLDLGRRMPKGAHLTIVLDCSFSVTVTRAAVTEDELGLDPSSDMRRRSLFPGGFLPGAAAHGRAAAPFEPLQAPAGTALLLAAGDHGDAYEGYFRRAYRGAFSWHAVEMLRVAPAGLTFGQFEAQLRQRLPGASYPQAPVLRLAAAARARPVFFF